MAQKGSPCPQPPTRCRLAASATSSWRAGSVQGTLTKVSMTGSYSRVAKCLPVPQSSISHWPVNKTCEHISARDPPVQILYITSYQICVSRNFHLAGTMVKHIVSREHPNRFYVRRVENTALESLSRNAGPFGKLRQLKEE